MGLLNPVFEVERCSNLKCSRLFCQIIDLTDTISVIFWYFHTCVDSCMSSCIWNAQMLSQNILPDIWKPWSLGFQKTTLNIWFWLACTISHWPTSIVMQLLGSLQPTGSTLVSKEQPMITLQPPSLVWQLFGQVSISITLYRSQTLKFYISLTPISHSINHTKLH